MNTREYDILVVGSGIAGLSFALKVAGLGRVALVTKKARTDSNTNHAQGGIAAVTGDDDDYELHLRDTLAAGGGLCHTAAVRRLVVEGPERVQELMDWGVQFSRSDGRLSLGREGGHSRRRILHAADLTGREIERALVQALAQCREIDVLEDHLAVDLLIKRDENRVSCHGAVILDRKLGTPLVIRARATLLAAGGLGFIYRHTTNPDIATGDGVAMAWRAGAELANLEFVQFHPTALYPTHDQAVLISEAVRGEGAILRGMDGKPLMEGIHPLGSLATRDVVARTIAISLRKSGEPHVLLDLSPIPEDKIRQRFPHIFSECAARGLDLPGDPIPVVPAAHYSCGGIRTDENGATNIARLFAVGEVACTGVHGANRLASNSLLEAVVFSHRAAESVRDLLDEPVDDASAEPVGSTTHCGQSTVPAEDVRRTLDEVRNIMWEAAGVLRTRQGLARATVRLEEIRRQLEKQCAGRALDALSVETRNMADVAFLIVRCALWRGESRGLHHLIECPFRNNEKFLRDTILRPPMDDGAPDRIPAAD